MKKIIQYTFILIIYSFTVSTAVNSQQRQRYQVITAYIYNFAKNVQWQNEEAIKEFHFLIIGEDKNVIQEMTTLSKIKTLRNKPIKVSSSATGENIDDVQLIYITKDKEKYLVDLFDKIEGKNILLVSDGYQDKRLIMINFIESEKGTLRFEINKANIINQHLRMMEDMILLGGTEIDVAALYREGQQSLRSLQKHTKSLENNLSQLERTSAAKTREIQVQKDSLVNQTLKIQEQKNILDVQSQGLVKREKQLDTLVQRTREQQKILEKGNDVLRDQQENINRQKSEIASQSKILEEQGATIHRQRNLVYLLVTIIALVVVLVFTIYSGYKSKQKLSKELEIKVEERTRDLRDSFDQLQIELIQRERTEAQLAESEQKYRELVEHANSIILRWTSNGEITFLNEFGQRFFGYSTDEIIGRHVVGTIVPKTESSGRELERLMEQICANPTAFEQNVNENMRRSGERVWIAWTNRIVLDTQGKVTEIFSVGTDITQRKRVEEALKESEAHYRYLFEQNPVPMLIYETGILDILAVNDAFIDHYGYTKAEALALHLTDLYPETEKRLIADLTNKLHGHAYVGEWHHLKKDGTQMTIEAHSHGFSYEGRAARIAVITDITERKMMEDAVQESERQISLIYDTVGDILFNLKMEKDGTYYFNSVNQCFLTTTGLQASQIVGRRVKEVVPEPSLSLVLEKYAEAIRTKKIVRWEETSEYPTGQLIGEVSIAPVFDDSGNCMSLVGSVHNITERKRTEEELQKYRVHLEEMVKDRTAELVIAKERAESADRLKSAFLATMSHELRTPLNSIIGFTGIIIHGLAGPLNNEQSKQLGMVQNSANHLLALINDVLDISKIEAGQLEVFLKKYDFRQSVEKIISIVRPLAERKGLELQTTISLEVHELVSDSRRVEQILLNLINNAIKFTEKGSVHVECAIADTTLVTTITDTGIGIRDEDFEKLFKPFSQIDIGTTRTYEGTGLGLSISKRLVEKLGGSITVQSELGIGSTFRIALPMIEG